MKTSTASIAFFALLSVIGFFAPSHALSATNPESIYGIPATGVASRALGSTNAAVGRFTADYAAAFDAALPPIQAADLDAIFQRLLATPLPNLDPMKLRAPQDVAKLFSIVALPGLTPKATPGLTVAGKSAYGIDPWTSVVLYAMDRRGEPPLAYNSAATMRPDIEREHNQLLAQIGIDPSQIQFRQTVFVSSRTDDIKSPLPDSAPSRVRSILTYASRSLAGVQVEGSYAKVISASKGRIVGLDVSWPAIRFHPGLRSGKCKDVATLKRNALPVIQRIAGGQPASVLMAYVLRPVRVSGQRVYVPALKIGVLSTSVDDEDKTSREIDEMVDAYIDLSAHALPYGPEDLFDDDALDPESKGG